MLTQTDFIAATPQYDAKSILSKERTKDHAFFELKITHDLFFLFFNAPLESALRFDNSPLSQNIFQLMKQIQEISKDTVYKISVGTNDEGIVGSSAISFK